MLRLALVLTALSILLGGTSKAQAKSVAVVKSCPGHVKGIYYYRGATRNWERKMGREPSQSNFNASKVHSCKYVVWVAHRWQHRAMVARSKYAAYLKLMNDPEYVICSVFGPYCSQAKTVAWCEGKYNPGAQNGQYLGTFQMGEKERATYGHGSTLLAQTQAAYRYFVASGKDWSPWECKP